MSTGIVVCTRLNSSRIPHKAGININGKSILNHAHQRLLEFGVPIVYAIPSNETSEFKKIFEEFDDKVNIHIGNPKDPLSRMQEAAKIYGFQNIVRHTHDKIFLDAHDFYKCLDAYHSMNLDYLYSSDFTPGTGFEIISYKALKEAADKFKNIEHISYSIKVITKNQHNVKLHGHHKDYRLLIDFEEDLDLITLLLSCLGNDCSQNDVFDFLKKNDWALSINKKPKLTVYTCAYNAEKYIQECMASVSQQVNFDEIEYLLIDDHSSDKTSYEMGRFASLYPNVKYIRNPENIGLASSSNVALTKARGDYILRLDADDYLVGLSSLKDLYEQIVTRGLDVIYPNNYYGKFGVVQKGDKQHHCGGAMFNTRAINHIKFTDGLRNYEGLDVWKRAKEQLKIGYLNRPTFFYRQSDNSMSKTNLLEREETKRKILNGETGLQ